MQAEMHPACASSSSSGLLWQFGLLAAALAAYGATMPALGVALGAQLAVAHRPGEGHRWRWDPRPFCALMVLLTVYLSTYPWHGFPGACAARGWPKRWRNLVTCTAVCAAATLSTIMKRPGSRYIYDALWCVHGYWLILATKAMCDLFTECSLPAQALTGSMAVTMEAVMFGWMAYMARIRQPCVVGMFDSRRWVQSMCNAYLGSCVAYTLALEDKGHWWHFMMVSLLCRSSFLLIFCSLNVGKVMCRLHSFRLLCLEERRVKGVPQQQAHWAKGVVRMDLIISVVVCLTSLRTFFQSYVNQVMMLLEERTVDMWLRGPAELTPGALHIISMATVSGLLWPLLPLDVPEVEELEVEVAKEYSPPYRLEEKDVYEAKVRELAGRGFSLRSLMAFWSQLLDGNVMPSFDPRLSTTNDVVREVVIPMSRRGRGGVALAELWNEGPVWPQKMVTHTWTNSFAHLTAAIVADALDLGSYAAVAEKLMTEEGVEALTAELERKGQISATYWVCAFAINQHASICSQVQDSRSRNSVSGELFHLCDCQEPKLLGDHPQSEMNKFDCMMAFLSQKVANFGQVIAVDEGFGVLHRAWCVAEIVEGSRLGLRARVEVLSQDAVDRNYRQLSFLDVRNCQASVPSDKEMILSKIANVEAFNLRLQSLVFGTCGLFADWQDGLERTKQVGRILRRALTDASTSSADSWPSFSSSFRDLDELPVVDVCYDEGEYSAADCMSQMASNWNTSCEGPRVLLELSGTGSKQDVPADQRRLGPFTLGKAPWIMGRRHQREFLQKTVKEECLDFISRDHFAIAHEDNTFVLLALSQNRLWLDRGKVEGARSLTRDEMLPLRPGDRILLGTGDAADCQRLCWRFSLERIGAASRASRGRCS
ncbi:unnamed protein product [Effrenium voratum]|uniref:FHA domain-containing protein n=1 Tax=Effrenium voratum TaxID=2562239 RepID=A0AA36I2E0_9DINO|nr:unnamed protein product [Effrenium voratum]